MSAVRRFLAHGVLAFALLVAQIGALAHAAEHLAELPAGLAEADGGPDAEHSPQHLAYCTGCLAFGGIDLPLFAHYPFPLGSRCALVPAGLAPAGTACSDGLLPHCRAPPIRA